MTEQEYSPTIARDAEGNPPTLCPVCFRFVFNMEQHSDRCLDDPTSAQREALERRLEAGDDEE